MNEEQAIGAVIDDIRKHVAYDILVVDDGSSDDTVAVLRNKNCQYLSHALNLGAWKSIQTGIRYALNKGYSSVLTMDADGQHRAKSIEALLAKRAEGFDLVIGSCTQRGTLGRKIAWKFFKLISGIKVNDLTSGLRLYSKPLMLALAGKRASMYDFQDVAVLLIAKHLGMRIVEVDVAMEQRKNGISRIFSSWWAVFIYLVYTLILTLSKSLRLFNSNFKKTIMEEGSDD